MRGYRTNLFIEIKVKVLSIQTGKIFLVIYYCQYVNYSIHLLLYKLQN